MDENPIANILFRVEKILLTSWNETGYGQVGITSKRINGNKIDVIIHGSTHFHFVIRAEDIEQWEIQKIC